jgi:hypothetical protein
MDIHQIIQLGNLMIVQMFVDMMNYNILNKYFVKMSSDEVNREFRDSRNFAGMTLAVDF